MRKIYKIISLLLFSVLTFASCIKSEEIETTSECAITSFSIGDIKTGVTVHREGKSDTIITRTISGSSIHFNIDQLNGVITTVDSIASWADLSKIKPSFSAIGNVSYFNKDNNSYLFLTSGADSINLEKPVEFFVAATDGVSFKKYTVSIKKSSIDVDTIVWKTNTNNFASNDDYKIIIRNNSVYAFCKDNEGHNYVKKSSASDNLNKWSNAEYLSGADIDYSSVILFKDEFFALSTEGYIFKASDNSNPTTWIKASDKQFTRLMAADKYYIYALADNNIMASADLQNWNVEGSENIDMLPTSCIESYSNESNTNANLQIVTMSGVSANGKYTPVWYKVSAQDEDVNQNWMYIQITNDNIYGLPKFKEMSYTQYNNSLYAIGLEEKTNSYQYIYRSDDNGITWKVQKKYPLPTEMNKKSGKATIFALDGKLWIIQKGGNIWSGTIK